MRAYMAYSRYVGPEEGAILVIHNTAREAKVLAWHSGECLNVEEYIDMRVHKLDDSALKLTNRSINHPHVVANPTVCKVCELWGCGLVENDGVRVCAGCGEYPGDELIERIRS